MQIMPVIFIFLPLLSFSNRLHYLNTSLQGPDWIITNCPISYSTNTIDSVPYQYTDIQDLSSGLMRLVYNFTPGQFPQVNCLPTQGMTTIRILQTEAQDFRVDGYEDLKIDLDINLTRGQQTTAYDSYIEVNYKYRQSKTVNFKVYYWRGPTATCSSEHVILSGIQFGFKTVKTDQHALEVCSPTPTSLRKTFDLTELGRYALSLGLLRQWDARRDVKIHIRTQGAGQIVFVQKAYHLERVQYIFSQQKRISQYTMANQPFVKNWSIPDFINMSLPINGSTKGIISEAFFSSTQSQKVKVNGHHWILIGLFFGAWRTPINSYGLPAEVHTDINIFINFSFIPEASLEEVGRAACYLLNFRDDFNPQTLNFSNPNMSITSKQFIIAVWTTQMYRNSSPGQFLTAVNFYGVTWKVKKDNNHYLIEAQTNLVSMKNFDIFAFVRYLRDKLQVFSIRQYLVTIQTGFRYNEGRGRFIVNELEYRNTLEPFSMNIENELRPIETSNILSSTQSIIKSILSISAVGTIVRLSPFISLVDEFGIYAYHRPSYDSEFSYISNLFLKWTKGKYIPPFFDQIANDLENALIHQQTTHLPNGFNQFGISNNFFKNISNFLVLSLPFNLLTFLLLMGLQRLLRRFSVLPSIQKILMPFRTFISFFNSTFVENMTYLSFYCFLQFVVFVPYYHGKNSFPSCVLCLLLLFMIMIMALCLSMGVWKSRRYFSINYYQTNNFKSYLFFSSAVMGKFASGFFHAYIDDAKYRALGLLAVNGCVFAALLFCCRAMQFKTYLLIYVGIYFGKVALHLQLLNEMWFAEVLLYMADSASENSLILVISIFGLMLIVYVICRLKSMLRTLQKRNSQKKQALLALGKNVQKKNQGLQSQSQHIRKLAYSQQCGIIRISKQKGIQKPLSQASKNNLDKGVQEINQQNFRNIFQNQNKREYQQKNQIDIKDKYLKLYMNGKNKIENSQIKDDIEIILF